ncbi:MAG: biotin-dependent carboxyltransferase family protein [Dehalococcoidia bacterium]|nr:biotin-dependent carboxyltransferase family protein [Dehalococcoidia bacterium]
MEIVSPGLLTTVQDLGRTGYQRYGIPVCGALDSVSLRIANILVGNRDHLAGLEITAIGPTIRFTEGATIAVVGADLEPTLNGNPMPAWESVYAEAGSVLGFGMPRDGLRAYLAVSGGIEAPLVMKSRSTDLKGGFGGFAGRALSAGDAIAVGDSPYRGVTSSRRLPPEISRQTTHGQHFDIRVVLGPQEGAFTEEGVYTLLNSEYTVSNDADRTGYRLEGPTIEHISGADIVSDGTALGSIQVPGGGTPIVLLADRGTTGGYTKIGTVISPDIGLIAQAMPGARIRFSEVSVEDARQILLEQERMIADIKAFVGLDLTGAFSMSASGSDFTVMDSDGRIVTSPGTHYTNRATRQVSATVEGERFEFEIEVATP